MLPHDPTPASRPAPRWPLPPARGTFAALASSAVARLTSCVHTTPRHASSRAEISTASSYPEAFAASSYPKAPAASSHHKASAASRYREASAASRYREASAASRYPEALASGLSVKPKERGLARAFSPWGKRLARSAAAALLSAVLPLAACHKSQPEPQTLRFLIESSPNNLDLRQGTDAQSERVGALIYDPLVHKDAHFNLQPWLATSWDHPDANTWTFHLRPGVRFHDGHPLTSADVAWTLRSMTNGTLVTAKSGPFANIDRIDTPNPLTLTLHTVAPDNSLLFNLSDGLFGVVEQGAGRDEGLHPIGTGPFRFLSQTQDKEVLVERNTNYWAGAPSIPRIRFEVVPDAITTALELKKGSADAESNAITLDEVHALRSVPNLRIESVPSSVAIYANFNVTDAALRDPRVRQAIAFALDKPALIHALWRDQAIPADSLLPPGHWARAGSTDLPQYPHDPARAIALLDQAGLHPDAHGIRLRFTLKTSTDEMTRVLAQAIQQQLAQVGIELNVRSAEFGTFYADITHGAFQMYILRWIGSNEDPDIFRYTAATAAFPPKGGNRGHYSNPRIDQLLAEAAGATDQQVRRRDYIDVQKILATDLPTIPLWYPNNEVVHTPRLTGVSPDPGGSFAFLRSARLQ